MAQRRPVGALVEPPGGTAPPPEVAPTPDVRDEDDPFAALVDELEATDTLEASPSDQKALQELFTAHAHPTNAAGRAPPGSPWPDHNFGAAYDSLRRDRPRRRVPTVLSESDVWDVDALTHAPPEPPTEDLLQVEAQPARWRTRAPAAPTEWLDTLDGDPSPRRTEAHLVDLVSNRPRPDITLLDTTEVLQARAPMPLGRTEADRLVPRGVELVGLSLLLLFALAILQLLLS